MTYPSERQTPDWDKLSKLTPPDNTPQNQQCRGAWLEGEMVGYAKCMVEEVHALRERCLELITENWDLRNKIESA